MASPSPRKRRPPPAPGRAGYSGTPLWKKLGYRDGASAYVDAGPANYLPLLDLPAEVRVSWLPRPRSGVRLVHLFTASRTRLGTKLRVFRAAVAPDGAIWVSWPKKASGVATGVTEDTVRNLALPLGLVDIKVCAVDSVWSGLKLVIRKELR